MNQTYSKGKGVVAQPLIWLGPPEEGKSRTLVILRSGDFAKKGVVLNYCPFCGEKLYDVAKDDSPTPPQPAKGGEEKA